jgi:hypothetical protein
MLLKETDPFADTACDLELSIRPNPPRCGHREGLESRKRRASAGCDRRTRRCRLPEQATVVRACPTATLRKLTFIALLCHLQTDKWEEQDEENEKCGRSLRHRMGARLPQQSPHRDCGWKNML